MKLYVTEKRDNAVLREIAHDTRTATPGDVESMCRALGRVEGALIAAGYLTHFPPEETPYSGEKP